MKGTYFQPASKSEFWKMLRSEILQRSLNRTAVWNIPKRNWLLKKLFNSIDGNAYLVQSPLYVSYGCNISVGKNFNANHNCIMMDYEKIVMGDNVWIGPNVSILTVNHPLKAEERRVFFTKDSFHPERKGNWEIIAPITIGNDVWIGAGAILLPGITIGDGATIGAGSVVTDNIPSNVLAVGNPCKVIRTIE